MLSCGVLQCHHGVCCHAVSSCGVAVLSCAVLPWLQAIRGRSERRYEHEAWHLQKAGLLNESHDIILKHIAPDAIINGMSQTHCSTPQPHPQLSNSMVVVVFLICGKINGCGTILSCLCDFSV